MNKVENCDDCDYKEVKDRVPSNLESNSNLENIILNRLFHKME